MKLQPTLLSLIVSLVMVALTCPADDVSVAFTPDIMIPAQLPQGHPRIYAFESDRENLLKKIHETKWAGDMYSRLEREVKPYEKTIRTP